MPGLTTAAPFPDDVPTHPLLVIDYALLTANDIHEIDRLWQAATMMGFWYLKNHGTEKEVDGMFAMGAETLDLPLAEKMKYEQGDDGNSFGYKARGTIATDANGTRDCVEFLNIAQDDALSWPRPTHRTYPRTVNARMEGTISPFVRKSMKINQTLLAIFEKCLGLPDGELARLHSQRETCGGEARCVKSPANQATTGIGAHTDFGTLTLVHNRLGGLQVMPPGTDKWLYIKPLAGHIVCNVGDALAIFSGGIMRSNVHRVMPPPGLQSRFERYSIAFFTRANDSVVLRALSDKSQMIAKSVSQSTGVDNNAGTTSAEWISRRIRKLRLRNREGWFESRGTEHQGVGRRVADVQAAA
ncbi:Clavaminate synthase-like protein [Obba rivulosa]|uniref:Clavaminate synthase-like protein n=1 Tax=Obba rivulosa TaxID=1052685 RepID=A0A8E2J7X1_9APHY|nr:Clavaminate synthase-like protein [Obba rivulosa]